MRYTKKGFVGYCKDEKIRGSSTSGGVCYILSEYIVENNGMVSGISINKNGKVIRENTINIENIKRFQGSKYVQAYQGNTYKNIKETLDTGKKVLFIGTPCQVAGLRSYLKKDSRNLICVDFVCLGITSQKVFDSYLKTLNKDSKVCDVNFKDKRNGWRNFTFYAKFEDGSEFADNGRSNTYMKSVIEKICNRPCCYNCIFRKRERLSDITVADAWGMEKIVSKLVDDKGTSSIMVNTEKGNELLNAVKNKMILEEVSVNVMWENNKSAWCEYEVPTTRGIFFEKFQKTDFQQAINKVDTIKKCVNIFRKFIWLNNGEI